MAARYLRADGSTGNDAFVYLALGSGGTGLQDVYAEADIYLCPDLIADVLGPPAHDGQGFFALVDVYGQGGGSFPITIPPDSPTDFDPEGLFLHGATSKWETEAAGRTIDGPLTAGTHNVKLHIKRSTPRAYEYIIDGVTFTQLNTDLNGYVSQMDYLIMGCFFPLARPANVSFVTNVKAGTTGYGSTDLISDDFSAGISPSWTGQLGDVSVVNSPCVGAPAGVVFRTLHAVT